MTAEQSTFMIDLHQVGMMLRYIRTVLPFKLVIMKLEFDMYPFHLGVLF